MSKVSDADLLVYANQRDEYCNDTRSMAKELIELRALCRAEPVAWISAESVGRLKRGGNGSRGTVPVHTKRSNYSTIPLIPQPKEPSDG